MIAARARLTADELYRLTTWKWGYAFRTMGFDAEQTRRLVFLKWRVASGRLRREG